MTGGEVALFAFTACNALRVVAYVPQILKIARDGGGASAISYTTWGLFGASHLSTVAYALATLHDWKLAFIFSANTAACAAIVGVTLYKRRRFAAQAKGIARADCLAGPQGQAGRERTDPCSSSPRTLVPARARHIVALQVTTRAARGA
jgi:hypothetical protein